VLVDGGRGPLRWSSSYVATSRLREISPYTYFVDVLQRIDTHPTTQVHELTPRRWKAQFAPNPLRSDLDRLRGP
jgi:hypothetical protein